MAANTQDATINYLTAYGLTPSSRVEAGGSPKAALVVDGRIQPEGGEIRASVRVVSGDEQTTLWSGAYLRPATILFL